MRLKKKGQKSTPVATEEDQKEEECSTPMVFKDEQVEEKKVEPSNDVV